MSRRALAGLTAALMVAVQLSLPTAASAKPDAAAQAAAAVPAAPADYAYDGAGQLRGVSQSSGGAAARWSYDDTGNPTGVTRTATGAVTVSSLNPSRAAIGARIVVSGTGFAATTNGNTVKLNGTTATVSAATATRLTVTVPTGATSGKVTVTTGSTTATSDQSFTVTAGIPAPTVGGFSPATGDIGASITITGTGFSTVKAENNVSLGKTRARVTAATATSLTVTVPAAASSGKITVVTPGGSASSTGEFLAVPDRYTAANIGATGTLTVDGTPTTVSLGTANKSAVLRFTGVKGQRLSLGVTGSTVGDVVIYGYSPHNAPFGRDEYNDPWWVSKLVGGLSLPPLPSSGTYQILLRPTSATATGSMTATLSSRIQGALSLTSAGTTVDLARPGQIAELSLDTAAGQSISYGFTDSTLTSSEIVAQIVLPNGTVQRWNADKVTGRTERVRDSLPGANLQLAPGAGRTTLLIGAAGAGTGKLTITASERSNGGALTPGVPKTLTAARPGQPLATTFAATAGQSLAIQLEKYTPAIWPEAIILRPDGTVLAQADSVEGWSNLPAIPVGGTYQLLLFTASTGTFDLSLWNRQSAGTATTTGAAVTAAVAAGRATEVTVDVAAPQRLSFAIGAGTSSEAGVRVRAVTPAGVLMYDAVHAWLTALDVNATVAGTYTFILSPLVTATGSATVTVAEDKTASLAVGAATTVTASRPGQRTRLNFTGSAGQRLALAIDSGTFNYVTNVQVLRPDGTSFYVGQAYNDDFVILEPLPVAGTYQLIVRPYAETGAFNLRLVQSVAPGAVAVGGANRTVTLTSGRYAETTVDGTAGQRLSFGFSEWAFSDTAAIRARMVGPSGQVIFDLIRAKGTSIDLAALPATGTYRLLIMATDAGAGGLTITASQQTNVGSYTLNVAKQLRFDRIGQSTYGTFAGTAGQALTFSYDPTTITTAYYPYLRVFRPDGTLFGDYVGAASINLAALPVTGTYRFDVGPYSSAGTATATLRTRAAKAPERAPAEDPRKAAPATPEQKAEKPARTDTPPEPKRASASKARVSPGGATFPPGAGAEPVTAGETWQPGDAALDGQGWITGRDAAAQDIEPLRAGLGVTALSGRVLTIEDKPLPNVTVTVEGRSGRTDPTGRFLLTGLAPGHRVLRVDGSSAGTPGRTFGLHDIGVDLTAQDTTVLPYTIWLSKLDTEHTVRFDSPAKREVVVKTPAIPGLEVRLPAGAVVRDVGGKVVTELGITAIPVDRAPFPLPKSQVPSYFTVQPGSSYIFPAGARVIYPNFTGAEPGATMDFWHYEPDGKGWFVYGTGTVTKDGKSVEPDKGTEVYEFTGAMLITPGAPAPPPIAPLPGGSVRAADPVDLRTGLLIDEHTDLTVDDVIPLDVTRTYQQSDTGKRAFGIGVNFTYGLDLYSTNRFYECWLLLPDGGRVHFTRTSPGGFSYQDAVLAADPTPTAFNGSTLTWNGDGWDLLLRDGTVYVFGDEAPLQEIRDKFGNTVTIHRGEPTDFSNGIRRNSGPITQVTSPNGKWIKFTYDASSRVTKAEDVLGRAVAYAYNAAGQLEKVTNVNGGVMTYTYESGRLKTIKDPRGTTFLTNEYDANGRVSLQTLPGGATYRLAYSTDATQLTDPRGNVRRVVFDSAGYAVSDTSAHGTALAQTTTITRDTRTHQPTAVVDPLNRRTQYSYDPYGNVKTVTELAGTDKARTTTVDRLGPFDQVSKVTDPLNHATSYAYKTNGALQTVTDALNRTVTFDTDDTGLLRKSTDAAQKSTTYDYALGDLVKVTDPLGNAGTSFTDAAGRPLRGTDALGNTGTATFDDAGQVTTSVDPLGRTIRYGYDANGNLHTVTDAREHTTTYDWDSSDRLDAITDPLDRVTDYAYDLSGNLTTVTSPRGKATVSTYDELDRVTTVRYGASGSTQESTTTYTYDAGNRTRTVADTAAGTTTVTPDDFDRPVTVQDPQGTIGYTYDAADRRATMTVPGQSATVYGYNNTDQVTSITRGTQTVSIGYDTAGRRRTLIVPAGITQTYGYDGASRLTSIDYSRGTTALGNLTYALDALGKPLHVDGSYARVSLPAAFGPVAYDAADQRAGNTYDADGNVTNDGSRTYTWNARNQLASVTKPGLTVTYGYDAAGRRASKSAAGATTSYLYDGLNAVQHKSGTGVVADLLTGGTDEVFARGSQSLLTDALGSTIASASGTAVTGEYTYGPFGVTSVSGDDQGNTTRFTGREDEGDGLYYYRSRYYSAEQQQFLSRDPIGLASGDTNPYAYVLNQPTSLVDPMGTKPQGAGDRCETNSFVAGTRVMMADGTAKPIEQIRPGDQVMAGDPESSADTAPRTVAATIVGEGAKNLITVETVEADGGAGGRVVATDGHPFWIDDDGRADSPGGRWVDAVELRQGQWLKTSDGRLVQVAGTSAREQHARVYNLTVDDLHTYFVLIGHEFILVHNVGNLPAATGSIEVGPPGDSCAIASRAEYYNMSTKGAAPDVAANVREYAKRANKWLEANGPRTVVSTKSLQSEIRVAIRAERTRNPHLYPRGVVPGHVPDTAVTGLAQPPGGWLPSPIRGNSIAGGGLSSRIGKVLRGYLVDGSYVL